MSRILLALGFVATGLSASGAAAGPSVDNLSIAPAAGPVIVEVRGTPGGGFNVKTKILPLKLRVHARASSGSRIVAAAMGSGEAVHYFEAGSPWKHLFDHDGVGGGSLRTFDWTGPVILPENRAVSHGPDADTACRNALGGLDFETLKAKRQAGYVLQGKLVFSVHAMAKLKGFAGDHPSPQDKDFNKWASRQANATYPVVIKCLPQQGPLNMVDGPKPGQPDPSMRVHLPMKPRR